MVVYVVIALRYGCLMCSLISLGILVSCGAARDAHSPQAISRHENLKELPLLPKRVAAQTLRIDGAGLQVRWLLDLLGEKNVQMLEISPQASSHDPQRASLGINGTGQSTREWLYAVASYMFVQLRVSHDGDATCIADKELPSDLKFSIRREPFLPDTCLSLIISPKSTARYHLRYNPHHEFGPPYGKWELFDHATESLVASLTTVDRPSSPTRTSAFSVENNQPYVALAALVDNRDATRVPPYQVYQNRTVLAVEQPFESYPAPTFTRVTSAVDSVEYTRMAADLIFQEQWPRAVEEARKTGWGNYGQQLIEQDQGAVIRLLLSRNFYSSVRAADEGFYAFPGHWKDDEDNWVARYDVKGALIWKITILAPTVSESKSGCASAGIYTLHTTKDELIFEARCRNPSSGNSYVAQGLQRVRRVVVQKRDIAEALASK